MNAPMSVADADALLTKLGDWFDNPNESPAVGVSIGKQRMSAGMVIRELQRLLREARDI